MNLIKKLDELLAGKKTFFGAALLALCVFAVNAGYIDQKTFETYQGLLIAWGFASLRAGIK